MCRGDPDPRRPLLKYFIYEKEDISINTYWVIQHNSFLNSCVYFCFTATSSYWKKYGADFAEW